MWNRVEKGLIEVICAFKLLLWMYIPWTQICFSGYHVQEFVKCICKKSSLPFCDRIFYSFC